MPIALFSIVLEACQLDSGVGEGSAFQWFPCDNGEVRSMSVQLGGKIQVAPGCKESMICLPKCYSTKFHIIEFFKRHVLSGMNEYI